MYIHEIIKLVKVAMCKCGRTIVVTNQSDPNAPILFHFTQTISASRIHVPSTICSATCECDMYYNLDSSF